MAIAEEDIKGKDHLQIYTLGRFLVKRGETDVSQKNTRSKKLWELFKYFLTNKGECISPETIMEDLWPEQECADPKAALHSLVYRMRKLFQEEPSDEEPIILDFSQKGYCFRLSPNTWVDFEQFAVLSEKADQLIDYSSKKAVEVFIEANSLYKGVYLPEYHYKFWLLPTRQYYRRLYQKNLLELIRLLKGHEDYSKILKICEDAFYSDPFLEEAELHFRYIEALVREGKRGEALSHYEYIASLLDKKLGVKPGASMQNLYLRIKSGQEVLDSNSLKDSFDSNLMNLERELKGKLGDSGAFSCDRDFFRMLYNLEIRRSERLNKPVVLCSLTICVEESMIPELGQEKIQYAAETLKSILSSGLRRGDAFCHWNRMQFLILFSGLISSDNADEVLKRIKREFAEKFNIKGITLKDHFLEILK